MTTYSPTTAAEIITAINTSASSVGDIVVLPDGDWDCSAATLAPYPGVTIRGTSAAACSVPAGWAKDLGGSADALVLEDFTLSAAGIAANPAISFDYGTIIGRRLIVSGLNAGSRTTLFLVQSVNGPTTSRWYDCTFTNSAGDVFACSGTNAYGAASGTYLYDCNISGSVSTNSGDQLLTTHNDHSVYMFGGTLDDSSRSATEFAAANGTGTDSLYARTYLVGVTVTGKLGLGISATLCSITSRTGNNPSVACGSNSTNDYYGCIIANANTPSLGIIYWDGTNAVGTFESCWIRSTGAKCKGLVVAATEGTLSFKNCRFEHNVYGISLEQASGTPDIHLQNCVFDDQTIYIRDATAGSVTFTGGYNSFNGSQTGSLYTFTTGDVAEAGEFDPDGRPTAGGNLDGTADQTVSLTFPVDEYNHPRRSRRRERRRVRLHRRLADGHAGGGRPLTQPWHVRRD